MGSIWWVGCVCGMCLVRWVSLVVGWVADMRLVSWSLVRCVCRSCVRRMCCVRLVSSVDSVRSVSGGRGVRRVGWVCMGRMCRMGLTGLVCLCMIRSASVKIRSVHEHSATLLNTKAALQAECPKKGSKLLQ